MGKAERHMYYLPGLYRLAEPCADFNKLMIFLAALVVHKDGQLHGALGSITSCNVLHKLSHSRRTFRKDCEYGLTYFVALFPPNAALLTLLALLLGAFLYLYADDLADGIACLTPLLPAFEGFPPAALL